MSLEITNIPVPSSPSPPFPNLGDVITTDDVSQKGTGKYTADYVNWCRVAHLLQDNAPGWQFHLAHYVDSSHVWKAPNGTGYVVGYFTGPNGERTPDFPQAVMDFKNNPVPYEKITARDVTDTHRRALAACAAFTFGLAWQLWAREEVEDPMRPEDSKPARSMKKPEKARSMTPAPTPEPTPSAKEIEAENHLPEFDLIKPSDRKLLLASLNEMEPAKLQAFMQAFVADFPLPPNGKVSDAITTIEHQNWINDYFKRNG